MTKTCSQCGLFHPQHTPCIAQTLVVVGLPDELAPGFLLASRYRILRTVHRGGMSVIYLAEDTVLGRRQVVVKELRLPQASSEEERREAQAWFAREAYILSSLNNELIPEFFSSFTEGGTSYIVQEYVAGENLNDVVKARGPLAEDLVLDWAVSLCGLLSYLHGLDEPVLFRDLKPSNIVLCDPVPIAGQPCPLKVVDFGIARHYQPNIVGTVIGTPGYAPPEQYQGLATPQSDVYALGATLHRLLTGYDPEHGTPFAFPPVRSLNPQVSLQLAGIVERALRLEPANRFQSASDMGEALFALAWEQQCARRASYQGSQPGYAGAYATSAMRSQRAFRWTALLVCLMMVAPGLLSVASAGFGPNEANSRMYSSPAIGPGLPADCAPAATDGAGGPYPALNSVDCTGQVAVSIMVVGSDPQSQVGFEPSNITVSRDTTVEFESMAAPDCTLQLQGAGAVSQPQLSVVFLSSPGDIQYWCQEYPNVKGVIHVQP
jgi:hypothetical protein